MTAINVIRQSKAVHILSDGVFCNAEGIICEVGPNAFALPHLPAALAVRGSPQFMPFLVHRLGRECRTFEDLLKRVIPVALEVHMSIPMTLGYGDVRPDFDLVIVGWSHLRSMPESYLVSNQASVGQFGFEAKSWQLLDLPDVTIAPPVGLTEINSLHWKVPDSAESFNPYTDGMKLLEAQRQSGRLYRGRNRGTHSAVGGFAQLTTVSSTRVDSVILYRWPDQAGQRIGSSDQAN